MKKPVLTISILVSNNYDNIKRCLDSIQPILKQVDSELILTDTGCDEKTRALIETYTDKIIDFEWIKDFSVARNVGLRAASGQWFMYVDDDEWFEDTKSISDFLLSKESENYDIACYIQRNYLDMKATDYVDHVVDRIIRINENLHFEHRVHEEYVGIQRGEKKLLDAYVHHYGYVYENKEEKCKKLTRNGELLELECAEHPEDMRMQHQLVMNLHAMDKWDEAIERALNIISVENDSEYWDAIHNELLYCFNSLKRWNDVIEYGKEFLNKKLYPYDTFGVRQYLIKAYWSLGRYKDVCKYSKVVIDTYLDYKKNPNKYNPHQTMRAMFWNKDYISKMLLCIIESAIRRKDVNVAKLISKQELKNDILTLMRKEPYKKWLLKMIIDSCKEERDIKIFEMMPFAHGVWDASEEVYECQIDLILTQVNKFNISLWEEWIFDHVAEGSMKEMFFGARLFAWKLCHIDEYVMGISDEIEQLEIVLSNICGYAEAEMYYVEIKYGKNLEKMEMEDLLVEEQVAFYINDLVNAVDKRDLKTASDLVKKLAINMGCWIDAIKYLPRYIELATQ